MLTCLWVFCVCVCLKEMREKEEAERGRIVHVDSLINHERDSAVS